MSALQIQTGERFVNAMGSLPCQYSEEELRVRVAAATEEAYQGKGTSIANLRKEVATW